MTDTTQITLSCKAEQKAFKASESASCAMIASLIAPQLPEKEGEEEEERAAVDLVTVIDKSGSMSGSKLDSAKETLLHVVEELNPEDRLSIIAYDTNVTVSLPLQIMDGAGKEAAIAAIKAISAGSSTNISDALVAGVNQLKAAIKQNTPLNDVKSLLLLTDGHANCGVTNKAGMISEVQQALAKDDFVLNCSLNTFGYGSSHNAILLKELAEAFGGMYFFMEDKKSVKEAFADCLGGILSVVAQNIVVTINAENGTSISKVHTIFPVKCIEPNKQYSISVGDIQSEEKRDLLINLQLNSIDTALDEQEVISCKVECFNVINMANEETITKLKLARPNELTEEQKKVNVEVDKQKNRMLVADTLKEAMQLGQSNKITEGKSLLASCISKVQSSTSANDPLCKQLIDDLEESKKEMRDKSSYSDVGYYSMNSRCASHYQQRSCNKTSSYLTSYKSSRKSKFAGE